MKKLLVLGSAFLMVSSSFAGLYRWVDDAGEVHYSDKVPVSATKKAHSKIDKHGITTKTVDPVALQKEKDEIDRLLQERKERERLVLEKRQARAKVQKRDNNLLLRYENEKELKHYFENKIKLINGNSIILKAQNDSLNKKVEKLEKERATSKHKATLESLDKKIVDINETIRQYEKALLQNDMEVIKLSKTYKEDIQRFSELTQ